MDAMARAARYGNVQPNVFEDMDFELAAEIARRVTLLHHEEFETEIDAHIEMTKAIIKSRGPL